MVKEITTNKYGRKIVRAEVDGYTGSAEVMWVQDDGYNAPHYSAFISIPFKDSKLEYLHSCKTEAEAVEKATEALEYALSRCTLI